MRCLVHSNGQIRVVRGIKILSKMRIVRIYKWKESLTDWRGITSEIMEFQNGCLTDGRAAHLHGCHSGERRGRTFLNAPYLGADTCIHNTETFLFEIRFKHNWLNLNWQIALRKSFLLRALPWGFVWNTSCQCHRPAVHVYNTFPFKRSFQCIIRRIIRQPRYDDEGESTSFKAANFV